jgi:hypothetical protein
LNIVITFKEKVLWKQNKKMGQKRSPLADFKKEKWGNGSKRTDN